MAKLLYQGMRLLKWSKLFWNVGKFVSRVKKERLGKWNQPVSFLSNDEYLFISKFHSQEILIWYIFRNFWLKKWELFHFWGPEHTKRNQLVRKFPRKYYVTILRNNDVIQFKQLTIFTFSSHANFETFFETAKLTLVTMMLIDGTGSENMGWGYKNVRVKWVRVMSWVKWIRVWVRVKYISKMG